MALRTLTSSYTSALGPRAPFKVMLELSVPAWGMFQVCLPLALCLAKDPVEMSLDLWIGFLTRYIPTDLPGNHWAVWHWLPPLGLIQTCLIWALGWHCLLAMGHPALSCSGPWDGILACKAPALLALLWGSVHELLCNKVAQREELSFPSRQHS